MIKLEEIKSERRHINHLFTIVIPTECIALINLVSNDLNIYSVLIVIILPLLILYHIHSNPLFSVYNNSSKKFITRVIYDEEKREISDFGLKNEKSFFKFAFHELIKYDTDFQNEIYKYVDWDEFFKKKLLDTIEYSIFASISDLYRNNWRYDTISGGGSTIKTSNESNGTHINFENLPKNLLTNNIVFNIFKIKLGRNRFKTANVYKKLVPIAFTLPPKTELSYNQDKYRTIIFNNNYLEFNISFKYIGQEKRVPKSIPENNKHRIITFKFQIEFNINLKRVRSLFKNADRYIEWANVLENDLRKQFKS